MSPVLTPTTTVEVLRCAPESGRTAQLFRALLGQRPAGVQVTDSAQYVGGSDWLLLWGPGAPDRLAPMRQQRAAGGHVIAFDLAYWQRERKIRVSIDAAHPQDYVLRREWPGDRLTADGLRLEQTWNPDGPILVAGIGPKARVQYGDAVAAWEAAQIQRVARQWPVWYRAKPPTTAIPAGAVPAPAGPIDQALRGCSLVLTWHSNVAVDAIRLGIPVVCRDGAAAAVCAAEWSPEARPAPLTLALQRRFLSNLAWFQWDPQREAAACWAWLRDTVAVA